MNNKQSPRLSRHKPHAKITPMSAIIVFFLFLYCLTIIVLLLWGLMTSFKDVYEDFRINVIGLPSKWTFDNFKTVYQEFYITIKNGDELVTFPTLFLYGFLYSIGCAFFATLIPCVTSYVCAKFNFKLSKIIYLIVIVAMILPIVGSLPAEIAMAKRFNLYNQIWGTWILKANFLGLYFIVFYNYFKALPNAYTEAAKIDGASNLRILLQLVLPMARPIFMTVLLINFITFWNDYQVPLVYLPDYPTIAVGMYNMSFLTKGSISSVPCRCAAAALMLVPVLVVFLAFHKKLLGNLTMGGIKG